MQPEALTGSREQLGDLLALWHVLDGGIDLLGWSILDSAISGCSAFYLPTSL